MDVTTAIRKRRAYRALAPVAIPRRVMRALAESARLAPSALNRQPWRFVFVTKRETLHQLFDALPDYNEWAKRASMIIAVCSHEKADPVAYDREIRLNAPDAPRVKGHDDRRVYYLFDSGVATGFLMLRATELGLVAHPIAGYLEVNVKKTLHIPDEQVVIALLIVGKRATGKRALAALPASMRAAERTRPARLAVGKIAFLDRYGAPV
ncbi:MAG TPA: nitroreductase family protein [Gemmatimonadaceae bacterium]|nr:nitroreductase family protein [Gemmatimonadaceae bacterium]